MVAPATLTRIVRVRILLPQPDSAAFAAVFFRGIAQLVARCVRDAEAWSSNLHTPTIKPQTFVCGFLFYLLWIDKWLSTVYSKYKQVI